MDTGKGYFETADNEEELRKKMEELHGISRQQQGHVFRVGEEIDVCGARMKVRKIGSKFITLKVMPALAGQGQEGVRDADGLSVD